MNGNQVAHKSLNNPVRQHTVSRAYLQRFCDDRGQMLRVLVGGNAFHSVSVTRASVVKNFYTLSPELIDPFAGERGMSEVESSAEIAFRRVLARPDTVPSRDDPMRKDLSAWVSLQHLRTTKARAVIDESSAFLVDLMRSRAGHRIAKRYLEKELGDPARPDQIDEFQAMAVHMLGISRTQIADKHVVFASRHHQEFTKLITKQPVEANSF